MPLIVHKVPSIYSLRQLQGESVPLDKGVLAAPEQSVSGIVGGTLPKLIFQRQDKLDSKRVRLYKDLPGTELPNAATTGEAEAASPRAVDLPRMSLLCSVLLNEWDDRAAMGLFRYDVTACQLRAVPGKHGFIAQLNEGRGSKRPTEFRMDKVTQPFDVGKFNFKKALRKEVLLQIESSKTATGSSYSPSAEVPFGASPTLIFINISPIEYGHVLLVPRVLDDINQLVTPDTLLIALRIAHEAANPYFRLGFNSLGAYGTVNHLHFQAFFLAAPFAVERAPTTPLAGWASPPGGVSVHVLQDYPVRGLVFEAGSSLAELAAVVGGACQRLSQNNVPHNMFVVDAGARIFLYPNCFAEGKATGRVPEDILETMVDPAVFEISGYQIYKRAVDYEQATEETIWHLLSQASYDELRFQQFLQTALGDSYTAQ